MSQATGPSRAAVGSSPGAMTNDPAEYWHSLLQPEFERTPDFTEKFFARLRAAKLMFGDRVHCPFPRPFFLTEEDERRVRVVAETIAMLGERVVTAALENRALFEQLRLRPEEERLARIPVGYARASTASRLDAFLLPDSLKFAEYNAESPAGAGYAETLAEIFSELPVMARFRERYDAQMYGLSTKLLHALLASYRDWGGTSATPQMVITDWRKVPTWSEFEILAARFEKLGVPTMIAEPRNLVFDGKTLTAQGRKIDLVYRRVLVNDIVARPAECEALVRAYTANAVCVANTFRCKIPHVKTFFAVLTDERNAPLFSVPEQEIIRRHIPWTRVVEDARTQHHGDSIELLAFVRKNRGHLVLKPSDEYGGSGVTLGWEASESEWEGAIEKAVSGMNGAWIVQEKIPIRREPFPVITPEHKLEFRDMLVDFAPYIFRGKVAGYLTRLSATGLANVTSGGGQVPAFRVCPWSRAAA